MAVYYNKLLYSVGGGIIDSAQQSLQDDCAVLAIGLGGTGIDCLRCLKRKVYERLQPDNRRGGIPEYKHIRFLAVDADTSSKGFTDDALPEELNTSEFFDISYSGTGELTDYIKDLSKDNTLNEPYREWLQVGRFKATAVKDGAMGIRQIGRFLLMQKADTFISKVEDLVTVAKKDLGDDPRVYVHVFSGMGGGTGSGTFLDACYLIRKALDNLGSGPNRRIMGYFFLPDVNLSRMLDDDQKRLPLQTKEYIKSNGYAAMQELDYCMGFEHNGDCWRQAYDRVPQEIKSKEPPVEWCHLISATTPGSAVTSEAYGYAMNVVADYVMDFLIRPDAKGGFGLNSHFSNISQNKNKVNKTAGASYDYLVLGASSAIVPYKRIMTYLASGLFNRLEASGIRERIPSQTEVDKFLEDVGLTEAKLLQKVQEGVDLNPGEFDVDPSDALNNNPSVDQHYADLHAAAVKVLSKNFTDLSKEVEGWTHTDLIKDGSNQAVMAKVINNILDVMTDPMRGPWYASALVSTVKGTDSGAALKSIKASAEAKRNFAAAQLADNMPIGKAHKKAHEKFHAARPGRFGLKKKCAQLIKTNQEFTKYMIKSDSNDTLAELAKKLEEQLTRLSDELIDPFKRTLGRLLDTFGENWKYLATFVDNKNPYETPVVTMGEIAPQLDAELAADNYTVVSAAAKGLFERLLSDDGRQAWGTGGNELRLARLVSVHFQSMFREWAERSLTGYLENKYDIHNSPQKLSVAIYKDLLRDVDGKSQPRFWLDGQYNTKNACAVGYVTVPQAESVVKGAAEMLAANDNTLTVRGTAVTDRISILRVLAGVPMWGYKGVKQYEAAYTPDPGTHLYEHAVYIDRVSDPAEVEASRDWRLLPSPTPRSKMGGDTDPVVRRRADESVGVLTEALREGIVIRETGGYAIRTISDEFMKEIKSCYKDAEDKPNDIKLKAQDNLKIKNNRRKSEKVVLGPQQKSDYSNKKKYGLSNILIPGNEKAEQAICADFLAKSPVFESIVRAELEKCHEIESYIKDLEPKNDPNLDDFCNALFTGVIEIEIPNVRYIDEKYKEETVLSRKNLDRGSVPLYQAFLSFMELDMSIRNNIKKRTKSILGMDKLPQDAIDACRAVKRELDEVSKRVRSGNRSFPREVTKIKELYTDLDNSLEGFVDEQFIEL